MSTTDKILEKADSLFHKFGIRSVSMDEIAGELGISKKTIYQSFKDKDDIVYQVTQKKIEEDKQGFVEVFENSDDAIDELVQMSVCLRKNLNDINPSLLFDIQKYHPRSWDLWEDYKNNFIKYHVLKSIERGKEEGFFRKEIDAEVMATFRIEQVQMPFDDNIFPRKQFKFPDVQMALFDHFVHGLLTLKGQEIYDDLTKPHENE
ncbi:MAG: TetR/AcrR family transcriptional regulator [Cyclobacteriaceae bacterium]